MSFYRKLLITLLILGFCAIVTVVYANATDSAQKQEGPYIVYDTSVTEEWTKPRLFALIKQKATEYNVSYDVMMSVIACESGFDIDIQSKHIRPDGTRERSFGLVQIYLPAHPNITYEQAVDPVFAADFLARNLALGKGAMWTCYRNLA